MPPGNRRQGGPDPRGRELAQQQDTQRFSIDPTRGPGFDQGSARPFDPHRIEFAPFYRVTDQGERRGMFAAFVEFLDAGKQVR